MIFVVAVVAAASAAAGPVYYQAAQHSILPDTLSGVPFIGRAYEATLAGSVAGTLPTLRAALTSEADRDFGPGRGQQYFEPPVDSIEASGYDAALNQTFPLVWRTGFCAHLVITGRCPTAADQVIVSKSAARYTGWHVGGQIVTAGWPTLTITGLYRASSLSSDFWILEGQRYFPQEENPAADVLMLDAVFTSQSTMTHAPAAQQGTTVADVSLALRRIPVGSVSTLRADLTTLVNSTGLSYQQIVVQSAAPQTLAADLSASRAVAVPVSLTTVTVLLLSWLLLFLIVTEAVEARGAEIALAKLRGHGRLGILVFGVSEPAVLLLASLPVGVLVGWATAGLLAKALLLPGKPVGLPLTTWAAAAAAVAGGAAAVLLAAQRALRRGVVEQFRRPSRLAAGRGWVFDSILLTGSVAGLIEVFTSNQIGSANHGVLQLLVPGLVGLAVAVIASRLLPLGCQALYGVTSRHGGLGSYLALRHIARRHGGIRTTIVLATAFCLAAFAFAAWSVGQRNYRLVAEAAIGAPDVLTVSVPPGRDLDTIVAKADPSGRLATAVYSYVGVSGATAGEYTIGVDPGRFAKIAAWPSTLSATQVAALTAGLSPHAAAPIVLTGGALRVSVDVSSMTNAGEQFYANVTTGATPVALGTLPDHGAATFTAPLTGCPCTLQSLALTLPGGLLTHGHALARVSGKLTITALEVRKNGRWVAAAPSSSLDTASNWRDETIGDGPQSGTASISAGPQGLSWTITGIPSSRDPTLGSADVPAPMPAIVSERLGTGGGPQFTGNGLDGAPVKMRPLAALPWIPGAPANGLVVDSRYADIEAGYNLADATEQVWLAADALPVIEPRLLASGVKVLSQSSVTAMVAHLDRQGPALASTLFLTDAAAAALLAAGAAILGLYVSARRRRYEYAALEASGIRRRTLGNALLIELAVVLGFGIIVGTATGLIAARFVLRSVPEFTHMPAEPPLTYVPSAGPVAAFLAAAAMLVIVAVVLSSATLIRGVRADLLRETPA